MGNVSDLDPQRLAFRTGSASPGRTGLPQGHRTWAPGFAVNTKSLEKGHRVEAMPRLGGRGGLWEWSCDPHLSCEIHFSLLLYPFPGKYPRHRRREQIKAFVIPLVIPICVAVNEFQLQDDSSPQLLFIVFSLIFHPCSDTFGKVGISIVTTGPRRRDLGAIPVQHGEHLVLSGPVLPIQDINQTTARPRRHQKVPISTFDYQRLRSRLSGKMDVKVVFPPQSGASECSGSPPSICGWSLLRSSLFGIVFRSLLTPLPSELSPTPSNDLCFPLRIRFISTSLGNALITRCESPEADPSWIRRCRMAPAQVDDSVLLFSFSICQILPSSAHTLEISRRRSFPGWSAPLAPPGSALIPA